MSKDLITMKVPRESKRRIKALAARLDIPIYELVERMVRRAEDEEEREVKRTRQS